MSNYNERGMSRVYGWDFLRGLCALAVGLYHLLMWLQMVEWYSFGSYGVYLFFVLSGASLAYTYGNKISQGNFVFWKFLGMRYARLAPLYILLMFLILPWKIMKDGATASLMKIFLMNGFFIFGFFDPAVNSILIGGWSLGIEFVYYFLFPLILFFVLKCHFSIIVFMTAVLVQFWWIYHTIGLPSGYAQNATEFHHPQAFIAYFVGGCILGNLRRGQKFLVMPAHVFAIFVLCGFSIIATLTSVGAGDELLGMRGAFGFVVCFFLVWVAGAADLKKKYARTAQLLGDATYGLYLIHPVVFFGLIWVIFPRIGFSDPASWCVSLRIAMVVVILAVSFLLALVSEKYFENPIRKRLKKAFA
ncbi:MAG: acyltransferase family protein [Acidovorax sp.]|uniref:acyltransferase family protein n=1 Tax=Acidovorax sp. TaxID=1872122 RepID=UPI00391DA9F5